MSDMTRWFSTSQATVSVSAVAQAKARTERARDLRAGDGMVLDAPLGDIVQQQSDEKRGAVVDRRQDFAGQRMFARKALLLDVDRDCRPRATDARPPCSGGTC